VVTVIFKIESETWGVPPPKNLAAEKHQNFGSFGQLRDLIMNMYAILRYDREYLRTGTRYRRHENGIANCDHSRTCLPNFVNFGPQTANNKTHFDPLKIKFFGRSYGAP